MTRLLVVRWPIADSTSRSFLEASPFVMLDATVISGPVAGFLAGLATSPHCALMCGPVTCLLLPGVTAERRAGVFSAYHVGRAISYAAACAALAAVGGSLLGAVGWPVARAFPWVLVAVLVAIALRLDHFLPRWPGLGPFGHRALATVRRWPPELAGAAAGLLTPLLPCAPLYALFALAIFSPSAAHGAEVGLAFALGTVPLLWLAQVGYAWLRRVLPPARLVWLQRAVALVAAAIVAWRAWAGGNPDLCL